MVFGLNILFEFNMFLNEVIIPRSIAADKTCEENERK